MTDTPPPDADETQALAFARTTRRRRVFFAVTAFGATAAALVGGLLLFGGQLQTAERARKGQAVDELRRAFNGYRDRCQGMWRHVFAVDFGAVPEVRARVITMRLQEPNVTCDEVATLAQALPRKPDAGR
ncbi:MAG TPA: hypothetical protein VGQ83_06670 [Polyangia bacterium]|jgi:hypothetical protein